MTIEGFEEVFMCHNKDVLYYLLGLTGYNYPLAEEIMQETFFRAYCAIHTFRGDSSVKTWLFGIAKNTLRAHRRKAGRSAFPLRAQAAPGGDEPGFESLVENKDILEHALLVIADMPAALSDVLTMRIFEGLPYAQIAAKLSLRENSTRVLFTRAKAELRKQLKEKFGYDITL